MSSPAPNPCPRSLPPANHGFLREPLAPCFGENQGLARAKACTRYRAKTPPGFRRDPCFNKRAGIVIGRPAHHISLVGPFLRSLKCPRRHPLLQTPATAKATVLGPFLKQYPLGFGEVGDTERGCYETSRHARLIKIKTIGIIND